MQNGRHLAELLAYHRQYRQPYLDWVAEQGFAADRALPNYRRALVGWYEASMDAEHPYRGEVFEYVKALAAVYYGQPPAREEIPLGGHPLDHLPRAAKLAPEGQELLQRFQLLPAAGREALLLADYHRLTPAALAQALDIADPEELNDHLDDLRHTTGVVTPAAELHWSTAVTVAGRQDLISTLEREGAPPEKLPPAAPPGVTLSRRRRLRFNMPSAGILVAGLLFGVLLYLLYTTFGDRSTAVYSDYFTPYPNLFTTEPPRTEEERDLQRILYYYDRGDYRTAYAELLPTADAYPAAPLYLGVSALALGDAARAREWLARLPADSPYRDAAEWYAALASLQLGGDAGTRASVEEVASAVGHPYQQQAQQLLSDL